MQLCSEVMQADQLSRKEYSAVLSMLSQRGIHRTLKSSIWVAVTVAAWRAAMSWLSATPRARTASEASPTSRSISTN